MKSQSYKGFQKVEHIDEHRQAHTKRTGGAQESAQGAHTRRAPGAHADDREGIFTAKDLADGLGIASSTLRTRWYAWLVRAVGESRLKIDGRFTELARELFISYKAQVVMDGVEAEAWAKAQADIYRPVSPVEVVQEPPAHPFGAIQRVERQAIASQAGLELERRSEALDRQAELLAAAKAALQNDIQGITANVLDMADLDAEAQAQAQELWRLSIQRDEVQRIQREQQLKAEEDRLRADIRNTLGKPSLGGGL